MTTNKQKATSVPAALNVYKKVAIIRNSDDVLTYEDAEGNLNTVNDLHLAAVATTPIHNPKKKDNIPVPTIRAVQGYERDIRPNYCCPHSYVRYSRPSDKDLWDSLEYVIDAEDETWLRKNLKFGTASATCNETTCITDKEEVNSNSKLSFVKNDSEGVNVMRSDELAIDLVEDSNPMSEDKFRRITPLPISMLEIILDVLEKATGFDAIITLDQAEQLVLKKIPQFYQMYPIRSDSDELTIRAVITDVYQYWISKRSKLKRPLLRRFWPVTSTDDTNPHLVFRPREKEKYKLRKKRQNDMDAYIKLQQLKHDFSNILFMLALIKKREEMTRNIIILQKEWFEQKLYDAIDTSGLFRISQDLDRRSLEQLLKVEKIFDTGNTKRKKLQPIAQPDRAVSNKTRPESITPAQVPSSSDIVGSSSNTNIKYPATDVQQQPVMLAGKNAPAPSFLQPLSSREAYATTWVGSVPYVNTIVDGKAISTTRFRHRSRVGRGGRVCIDRVPMPTDPNCPPHTYLRAGSRAAISYTPKERLLDLLPPPVNKDKLSRRIQEICLSALSEDYDAASAFASYKYADGDADTRNEVVVQMKDWLDTDEQIWGEERYSIGPI